MRIEKASAKIAVLGALLLCGTSILAAQSEPTEAGADTQEKASTSRLDQERLMKGFIVAPDGTGEAGMPDLYLAHCSSCHGQNLEGTGIGSTLASGALKHGDKIEDFVRNIENGFPELGMPGWKGILSDTDIRQIALYVSNYREAEKLGGASARKAPAEMPTDPIETEEHTFKVEMVSRGFSNMPFSIAPLPDGRWLLTEKMLGLSIVSPDGTRSGLIKGLPRIYNDSGDSPQGLGWMLDVALHPDYEQNGWIYIHYTDRCEDCNAIGREANSPVSMNKVIRGRIEGDTWVDQQTIWETDVENYTYSTDMCAGGRLAFDGKGHLFLSIGCKGPGFFEGIQDLSKPYGKIYRVNDDGSIPDDNPTFDDPNAVPGLYTVGHRTPLGLEYDTRTGLLWGVEQGPMGGDELNLLVPGGNFGWPLTSKGLHYDGRPVDHGEELGVEWKMEDIQQPVYDFTPSPAISGLIIYEGGAFPAWKDNIFIISLKAQELYRIVLDGEKAVHKESILKGLGRIRDIEVGNDGAIYLLTENASEGQIIRLVNADE